MGPNFRFCSREYFDYADHTVILTERGVEEHLYAAGFKIISVCPQFLPYTFSGRLPSHPALVHAYLRMPFAWRILGKQFLVIAERVAASRTWPARPPFGQGTIRLPQGEAAPRQTQNGQHAGALG